jgi:hypothetical protein
MSRSVAGKVFCGLITICLVWCATPRAQAQPPGSVRNAMRQNSAGGQGAGGRCHGSQSWQSTLTSGGPSFANMSQLQGGGAGSTAALQGNQLNQLAQLQVKQALSSSLQQARLNALYMAAQQQRAAQYSGFNQQQLNTDRALSASLRKQRRLFFHEEEDLAPRLEVKRMEDESTTAASGKQLQMAKEMKRDADLASIKGDRARAAKLRAKVSQRLSGIVDKYQGTSAAREATSLLEGSNP